LNDDETATQQQWHCPHCQQVIGTVNGAGELVVGTACIEVATFRCLACGYRKSWRRSDSILDRITLDRQPSFVV
jgi:hypothetical protein